MRSLDVTVLIPCFNAERTIEKAINSILNSSVLPHEILIYDDCSTDNTAKIIEEKFFAHKIVHFTKASCNRGAGYARNELLKKAKCEYVAFLDADDWWYSTKLEKQMKLIEETNCDIVACGYDIFNELGEKIGFRTPIANISLFTMHLANWLPTSMTIFRKGLKGAEQMPFIRRRQDYGFWLKIFQKNKNVKCCVIGEALGGYTRSKDSLSSSKLKNFQSNYIMFRDVIGYGIITSFFLICINAACRILRK